MKVLPRTRVQGEWVRKILQWVNLRPEEGERTGLMFAFYTATSIGLLWFEYSATALFLDKYGAKWLPVIYIASALMCSGLGVLYSWLQRILPMRGVLVAIALLAAIPLLILRLGLGVGYLDGLIAFGTVFLLRLWMDAVEVLNDLNSQVAANQLFNIREIKRTYPLISSGLLVADVISGFSLPFLLFAVGLNNVIIVAGVMMLVGAGALFYLTQRYSQAFPDSPTRYWDDDEPEFAVRRTTGPLQRYIIPLFAFFILGEALYLLVEFQYLGQLEVNLDTADIAGFLGLFSGVVGLFELTSQWFLSSRVIDQVGVFVAAMVLPAALSILGLLTLSGLLDVLIQFFGHAIPFPDWVTGLFVGLILLRFIDELLRYTLIAGIEPFLFQPIAEAIRNSTQTTVQGIAEPITTGISGIGILATIGLLHWAFPAQSEAWIVQWQSQVFIFAIVLFSLIWLLSAWLMRSSYVSLLVQSAEQGRLGFSDVDLKAFKRVVVEALEQPGTEADKRSCIQLLSQIDPMNVGEVLAPLLPRLSPALQSLSLDVMLDDPNPSYLSDIQVLIDHKPPPDVLALALRYVWLSQPELDIQIIKPYLQAAVDPTVRGTAAALILRRGTPSEKAEATNALRRMLTSKRERERVMGTRALGEAEYLQALRLYIPNLLQDESLRVRCALLEVIAATHLQEYYPSLVKGLYYKSTREAARSALVRLGNEGIPLLLELAEDIHKPDLVRLQAWMALGEINTPEALHQLVQQLMTSWGTTRRNIVRILVKIPNEAGIDIVLDQFGRSGIETLIDQEFLLLGQIYGALLDLTPETISGQEADLLRRALQDLQTDVIDRCFWLMKFLYPVSAIQAAAFNLESESRSNIAMGLEILDNTIDIPYKRAFLGMLDRRSLTDKLDCLVELVPYQPMNPSDRLRRLLELRHFLSDWTLACCFHLAKAAHVSLTPEGTLVCLRHPTGFVREAVLAYLKAASPRACIELLPMLKNDSDRLVSAVAQQMIREFGLVS
ncbi:MULTISPECIES: HEAT repeat domain-containing protein [unclassified Coleofasciculus]|uniref:HEAT repeat domain-containing protein n=1 Tax=unclassified Coleofasciculus TaxID=2692782 RepID=UPI00187E9BF1|nr:HEAT repeat domain-containing protein [Coleofasciculus sp. LEGE 07092]MBE9128889.1 MFS transporter [Coleofasciculus sp. LEGE 07081]MBE9151604.1 MFS transporter [Coleofasciculus sp. LEGE 07092]